ncbi:MAG: hypothetical protein IPK22_26840 [Verrucomicrobiaceae bacterium]|nr:hypothetical protein [Verrucomicrobiaceae bacterium]
MTTADTILAWARTNSGIISVAGALIIFFSWVITNTLGQRYSRMKAATESAQATFRLYTTLHEQRNQLNSVAMEIIQRREAGVNASILGAGKTGDTVTDEARKDYGLTRLSAHQVRELMDFTGETHALSRAVGEQSSASAEIEALLIEVGDLHRNLISREREAETAVNSPNLDPAKLRETVQSYSEHFRSVALPRVPKLYGRIVDSSNKRAEEASQYLDTAKAQAELAGKISIFLYVIGSCLALIGQAIEKTKPKDDPAKATTFSTDGTTPDNALQLTGSAVKPAAATPEPSEPSSGRASAADR